jgi:hypothetical protein
VAPGQARPKGWSGRADHFADWHGVAVLLKICAHRIDGQSDAANKRITSALGIQDPGPKSSPVTGEMTTASRRPEMPAQQRGVVFDGHHGG